MGERFEETTEHLRDAGCAMLLERGPRAFTLDGLAKFAFVSVGSVYERWSARSEALHDVINTRVLPSLDALDARGHAVTDPFALLLDDADGDRALRLCVETVFAARDDAALIPDAATVLERLQLLTDTPRGDHTSGHCSYLVMTLLGFGLLRIGGCDVPPNCGDLARLFGGSERAGARSNEHIQGDVVDALPLPPVGELAPRDSTGAALRESTRMHLEDPTAHPPTARAIARSAGVTTGAMYRRFGSTSELFIDVLMGELQAHRYAWMQDLVTALRTDDPIDSGASVLATAVTHAIADNPTNRMLLEITVTARTDESVRRKLVEQIELVVQSRVAVFTHLAAAGLIRPDVDPRTFAWLLQAPTIGGRLLGSIDLAPTTQAIHDAITGITERSLLLPVGASGSQPG